MERLFAATVDSLCSFILRGARGGGGGVGGGGFKQMMIMIIIIRKRCFWLLEEVMKPTKINVS